MKSDDRLRAFLADTLALWRVEADVDAGQPPAVARIRADDGTLVSVERIPEGTMPFRWMVRSGVPGASHEARSRPCGSLVGVLGAMRVAFGVDRGSAVHIAPSPADE